MRFRFDEKRATQAAAYLLDMAYRHGNYISLLNLLYLADRESIKQTGFLITGSEIIITQSGIYGSEIYECIKGDSESFWKRHLATKGYVVELVNFPGTSELSRFDTDTLDRIHRTHRYNSTQQILAVVRKLPEWSDVQAAGSEVLAPEEILRAAGVSAETIKSFSELNEHVEAVNDMLSENSITRRIKYV